MTFFTCASLHGVYRCYRLVCEYGESCARQHGNMWIYTVRLDVEGMLGSWICKSKKLRFINYIL
jgi:hypothetical protein